MVDHPGGQPENLLLQRLQHLQVVGLQRARWHRDVSLGSESGCPKPTPMGRGMTCQRRHFSRPNWHPILQRAPIMAGPANAEAGRSEEHTSELQSLMRISYAVFCLKK